MKKTLKKDITRYDKKMQLQFNKATIKAVGISLTVAIPLFLLFNFIAGIVPGIFIAFTVGCLLTTLQVGKIDGIPLIQYALKALKFGLPSDMIKNRNEIAKRKAKVASENKQKKTSNPPKTDDSNN